MRINRTAYVCAGYIEHGTCSRMTAIPRKQAEAWLTAKLSDLLSATPDANTLHRWLHDQSEYREWMVKLHVRQSTIDRTVKRMENATNRLLDGTLTPGEFRDIQTRLRSALADAQQEPDVPIEFIEVWREQVQALQANIASPQDILFVRRALHQVIDHITVTTTRDLMIAWREPPPPYDPNIDLDAG